MYYSMFDSIKKRIKIKKIKKSVIFILGHLTKSTGERNFKCDVCLKTFNRKCRLETHSKIHTGERNFKCNICLKTFNNKYYLVTHSKIHTGENNFKCVVCSKTFIRKSQLREHGVAHTGEKIFKCDIWLKVGFQWLLQSQIAHPKSCSRVSSRWTRIIIIYTSESNSPIHCYPGWLRGIMLGFQAGFGFEFRRDNFIFIILEPLCIFDTF
ncbi:unnamed protein product [Owenia fusiformis]|uniref:C2H2-type domain-containing protein n=1 Tax=Owenia fusiformis TaxID=6347 RepID=A0A8S4NLE5_OWEFU|nr:unnamed protein product [Owenia fusiformis]